MRVQVLASRVTDNWFTLLVDGDDAVLIDPIDAELAIDAVRAVAPARIRVVNTHWHPDHTGGNATVRDALEAPVSAPALSAEWGVAADAHFEPGDTIEVGATRLAVLAAPGHTSDHVILAGDGVWISGDVLFAGGIGHCRLGGDVATAWRTIRDVVGAADGAIRFYPGHDYAEGNARFALSLLPGDAASEALLADATSRTRADGLRVRTIDDERRHNLFLRCAEPAVQDAAARAADAAGIELDAASLSADEAAFHRLRALRDRWRA